MELLNLITNEINQNNYHSNKLTRNKIGILYIAPINMVPDDCLACDGYVLKISDYKKLYSAIGNKFNKGSENSDEFRIPDYNITKRFLQPGSNAGTIIAAGLPNITGTAPAWIANAGFSGSLTYGTTASHGSPNSPLSHQSTPAYKFDAKISSAIYGKSSTVQPPSQLVHICIKYK